MAHLAFVDDFVLIATCPGCKAMVHTVCLSWAQFTALPDGFNLKS